jgi:hypothetical protein
MPNWFGAFAGIADIFQGLKCLDDISCCTLDPARKDRIFLCGGDKARPLLAFKAYRVKVLLSLCKKRGYGVSLTAFNFFMSLSNEMTTFSGEERVARIQSTISILEFSYFSNAFIFFLTLFKGAYSRANFFRLPAKRFAGIPGTPFSLTSLSSTKNSTPPSFFYT